MERKTLNKRIIIGVASVAVVALLGSIISSSFILTPKKQSGTKDQTQTAKQQNTTGTQQASPLSENAKYADVVIKGNVVSGDVTVPAGTKDEDALKLGQDYANQLQGKNPGKQIEVHVTDTEKKNTLAAVTQNYSGYAGSAAGTSIPKATVTIGRGVLDFDRLVEVALDTPTPEKYTVSILGQTLKYVPARKIFHQVIQETDENKIRNNIKVNLNTSSRGASSIHEAEAGTRLDNIYS